MMLKKISMPAKKLIKRFHEDKWRFKSIPARFVAAFLYRHKKNTLTKKAGCFSYKGSCYLAVISRVFASSLRMSVVAGMS